MAVLLTRGDLPPGWPLELELVSDPSLVRGAKGDDGLSTYQLARQEGYGGTLTQWLTTLVGAAGLSAYQIARAAGYGGTETQWLASLKGEPGSKGADGTNAATLLGTFTLAQTATIALSAGVRQVQVTVPASYGLAAGDAVLVIPAALMAGYAVHNAVAVSATRVDVVITAPLLALNASFSMPCRLYRLNG